MARRQCLCTQKANTRERQARQPRTPGQSNKRLVLRRIEFVYPSSTWGFSGETLQEACVWGPCAFGFGIKWKTGTRYTVINFKLSLYCKLAGVHGIHPLAVCFSKGS